MDKPNPCRHRTLWIICGGRAAWCYRCGAWRKMRPLEGTNSSAFVGRWIKPTGPDGPNPWKESDV